MGQREDSVITAEHCEVIKEDSKFVFLEKERFSYPLEPESLSYPAEDFIKTYSVRVVNDTLK